jgi:hypothetical protein
MQAHMHARTPPTHTHTHTHTHGNMYFVPKYRVTDSSFFLRGKRSDPVTLRDWKSAAIAVQTRVPILLCRSGTPEYSAHLCPRGKLFVLYMCRTASRAIKPN